MTAKIIRKEILVFLILVLGLVKEVVAQQQPMYTQYMFNTLSINPAYAGTRGMLSVMAMSRLQWLGFDGAPITHTITAHTPFENKGLSLGLSISQDKIGPITQSNLGLDLAYRIKVGNSSELSFGLNGSVNLIQGKLSDLKLHQNGGIDQAFNKNIDGTILPNFGAGFFWHSDFWYVGISAPRILELQNKISTDEKVNVGDRRHLYLIGGYVFELNSKIKFKPTTLVKMVEGAPLSVDFTGNFLFYEKFWLGAMYRLGDSFGTLIQYQFTPQLRVGYSLDYNTTVLRKVNSGTHEIMISYDFQFVRQKVRSPRYF